MHTQSYLLKYSTYAKPATETSRTRGLSADRVTSTRGFTEVRAFPALCPGVF